MIELFLIPTKSTLASTWVACNLKLYNIVSRRIENWFKLQRFIVFNFKQKQLHFFFFFFFFFFVISLYEAILISENAVQNKPIIRTT
jgi:hypothetical protein